MWEDPTVLWHRLKLGREEYLQRLVTTLILDGNPPPWNTSRSPGDAGGRFLQLLDEVAHGSPSPERPLVPPDRFVDEYLLPKLEDDAANGWPDWAVLWGDRVWVIELKTEAGSHRADQLPYYLRLAAAAHPDCYVDLTYITGPLTKPAPALSDGQRYSHVTWEKVVPLIEDVWGDDPHPAIAAYVQMVIRIVRNLGLLKPAEQRQLVLGTSTEEDTTREAAELRASVATEAVTASEQPVPVNSTPASPLLGQARATAADGRQRAIGAHSPSELEALCAQAHAEIGALAPNDDTRFVLPWLWDASRTGGAGLTPEGEEFGYELRFSRYRTIQVTA